MEDHRLRVFENRVLRKTFAPKRDEVIGGWRELYVYIEELHNLYCSLDRGWANQVGELGGACRMQQVGNRTYSRKTHMQTGG
jgi:hypothetical protein